MKKIGVKKLLALILIFALTLSGFGNVSQAASKRYVKSLKLSKSTVSIKKGKRKLGYWEIENWMTEICVRIVRKNYHHGLRSGGIVR